MRVSYRVHPFKTFNLGSNIMAYFILTSTDGRNVIINGNPVTKVVDFGSYRTIYYSSEAFHHQVKETLSVILTALKQT